MGGDVRALQLIRATIVFVAVFFSCFAVSQNNPLTFYVVDYPPYLVVSQERKSVSGMDAEIIKAAYAAVDVSVSYDVLPWNTILDGMQTGKFLGTASCTRRPERLPYMLYSDEISTTSQVLVSRKELDASAIKTLQDLRQFDTISVVNWGPQKLLEQLDIPHQTTTTLDEALLRISDGKADLLYIAEYPALAHAKKLGVHDEIKITSLAFQPLNTQHLCFSRQYPHSRILLEQFNLGLREIKRNGTYQAIRNRYL